ncbi:DNA methyltransferase [Nitratireductor pacificus]|uniref:Methyltransferase n=1 Tax=Nitratireductor pacificus pht-3B TaxID=391937 RepID=K2M5P5_9HYPH|nr:DNA methyltransferase [Nitratireductor pacificus]EKF17466.1 adenine DNA methyltransferase [Nitratireductor pacificus pht-3B]
MARNNVVKLARATPPSPTVMDTVNGGKGSIQLGDSMTCYAQWPKPTAIIADGPYGLAKFPGEPHTADGLDEWYAPHVAEWSKAAMPETTLWFWCSELGWAEVHRVLKMHGWKYKAAHIWNKGIGHIAGNVNGDTIRGFPVVTEICVQYVRDWKLATETGDLLPLKQWLRHEWQRSGLPLYRTNEACGVKNAATRKYFTQCHLWYFPPADKMELLAAYATKNGAPTDRPYFSLDGKAPLDAEQWSRMRAKWSHAHGITNVWDEPAVRGDERLRAQGLKSVHINQKPLRLMERIINASTEAGDVIWEPFGGLCSATVGAMRTGRQGYAAEVLPDFYTAAVRRLKEEAGNIGIRKSNKRNTA